RHAFEQKDSQNQVHKRDNNIQQYSLNVSDFCLALRQLTKSKLTWDNLHVLILAQSHHTLKCQSNLSYK
ncbi:41930_t:CDS:1, partial [Gigaspora margarita]